MNIPPIDPKMLELSRDMTEAKKKRERKQYLADHLFDIINSALALIALIVAILGLFFPKGLTVYQLAYRVRNSQAL